MVIVVTGAGPKALHESKSLRRFVHHFAVVHKAHFHRNHLYIQMSHQYT